ncbi:hypothetical protein [Corallococcus macrosporus]|uniref:Uncharacterized protein n=1 Tax=Corallococcus macrosporus DSM 14697 TaxID=1189310 RepID=A0A250JRE7_9BACT|nr:hypothetical protein [Corallococcus macrosporus]ATB45706.1 hypothetical protein MYMAC_001291 [Corallococcus macrosporus DSM 14697]
MRATGSSRVGAVGLAALLLSHAGCSTTSEYVRGPRLREVPLGETHRDALESVVDGSYVGRVAVKRTTCTEVSTEFSKNRIDTTTSPPMDSLLAGLAMLGGGGLLMSMSDGESEDEDIDLPMTLGVVLALASIYPLVTALTDEDVTRAEVATGEVEAERSQRCEDRTFALSGPLHWSVSLGAAKRTGRTGKDGAVALRQPLSELVEQAITDEASVRRLVAGRGIGFRLELERAPAADFRLDSKALPDSYFRRFADAYGRQLGGGERARFENCELIGKSARETLECYWSQ